MATFALAWLGRRHAAASPTGGLSDEKLNRWLIGLSAGAAANSGFVVTGAVGLGYVDGMRWVLLPLGWLVGDIVFWTLFPGKLNRLGRELRATTLSELLTRGLTGAAARPLGLLCAAIVLVCLSGYLAAQWLAGQKFLAGAFPVSPLGALVLFALMIVSYTAIGGFRGSVYVDSLQAVIRIIGTAVALGAVFVMAGREPSLHAHLAAAGPDFLRLAPSDAALVGTVAFTLGFGAASLGFNLGQPHLVSRYLAGADPQETRAAWWIYIGFVQFTWTSMTIFGVALRGVMPGLSEPEAGLSTFFHEHMGPIATGLIVADVFATISATSNSLLVAMAQALGRDVIPLLSRGIRLPEALGSILLGALTMGASLVLPGSVKSIALSSVSLMSASVAPAVLIRVVGWRHDARTLTIAVVAGFVCAMAWRAAGLDDAFNESAPGIAGALIAHYSAVRFLKPAAASCSSEPLPESRSGR